jgi:hypothetical protein
MDATLPVIPINMFGFFPAVPNIKHKLGQFLQQWQLAPLSLIQRRMRA